MANRAANATARHSSRLCLEKADSTFDSFNLKNSPICFRKKNSARRPYSLESMAMKYLCPACGSGRLKTILTRNSVPRSSQAVYDDYRKAADSQTARLDIVLCKKCSVIYNRAYKKNNRNDVDSNYYFSVSFTPSARAYQKNLVGMIHKTINLENRNAMEIGCGDGYFLNEISKRCNSAIGFEPSQTYAKARRYRKLKLFKEWFYPHKKQLDEQVDLFILRHVLEHVPNPVDLLYELNHYGGDKPKHLFLEVPNTEFLLKNNMHSDFYYDHIFYFNLMSLYELLNKTGWGNIERLGQMRGEFITLLCSNQKKQSVSLKKHLVKKTLIDYERLAMLFSKRYINWRKKTVKLLAGLTKRKKNIAVWGAGSRGVTLICDLTSSYQYFKYVVDSDPGKDGCYLPINGMQIHGPAMIPRDSVDHVLVTSFTYFDEIFQQICRLCQSRRPKVIKIYPNIEIL